MQDPLSFTLAASKAPNEEMADEQMDEVAPKSGDLEDDSSSGTLSVSAIDEDDLRMLNQALTGTHGSNDQEEEKQSAAGTERSYGS